MIEHDDHCPDKGDRRCDCEWEARVRADERERIAQAIEAQRMDLSGYTATGELWIDGHYVGVLGRTDYRIMNGVRDMDAHIARGGAR